MMFLPFSEKHRPFWVAELPKHCGSERGIERYLGLLRENGWLQWTMQLVPDGRSGRNFAGFFMVKLSIGIGSLGCLVMIYELTHQGMYMDLS
jgi:hypothetical protein